MNNSYEELMKLTKEELVDLVLVQGRSYRSSVFYK